MAKYRVVLNNDDANTFDHVIDSLIDVCGHNYYQALQCATIVHNNKQCAVFHGNLDSCETVCELLLKEDLDAVIEKIKRKK